MGVSKSSKQKPKRRMGGKKKKNSSADDRQQKEQELMEFQELLDAKGMMRIEELEKLASQTMEGGLEETAVSDYASDSKNSRKGDAFVLSESPSPKTSGRSFKRPGRAAKKGTASTPPARAAGRISRLSGLVFAGLFLCLSAALLIMSRQAIMESADREMHGSAEAAGAGAEAVSSSAKAAADSVASYIAAQYEAGGTPEGWLDVARQIAVSNPEVYGIRVLSEPNVFGSEKQDYGFYVSGKKNHTEVLSLGTYQEYSAKEYYQRVKESYREEITLPYKEDNVWRITYAVPVVWENDLLGVVAADVNMKAYQQIFQKLHGYVSQYGLLLDSRQNIVSGSSDMVSKYLGGKLTELISNADGKRLETKMLKKQSFSMKIQTREGRLEEWFLHPTAGGTDSWWAVTAVKTDDKGENWNHILFVSILFVIVGILFLFIFLLFLLRRLLEPVEQAQAMAQCLADGELKEISRKASFWEMDKSRPYADLREAIIQTGSRNDAMLQDLLELLKRVGSGDFTETSLEAEAYVGEYQTLPEVYRDILFRFSRNNAAVNGLRYRNDELQLKEGYGAQTMKMTPEFSGIPEDREAETDPELEQVIVKAESFGASSLFQGVQALDGYDNAALSDKSADRENGNLEKDGRATEFRSERADVEREPAGNTETVPEGTGNARAEENGYFGAENINTEVSQNDSFGGESIGIENPEAKISQTQNSESENLETAEDDDRLKTAVERLQAAARKKAAALARAEAERKKQNKAEDTKAPEQGADSAAGGGSTGHGAYIEDAYVSLEVWKELLNMVKTAAAQVDENARDAALANEKAGILRDCAADSHMFIEQAIDAIARMGEAARDLETLEEAVEEIASHSSLASLSVARLGAKAGAAGEEFARAAEDLRGLAEQSSQAAERTRELAEKTNTEAESGGFLAENAAVSLYRLREELPAMLKLADSFEVATANQATALDQMAQQLEAMQGNSD